MYPPHRLATLLPIHFVQQPHGGMSPLPRCLLGFSYQRQKPNESFFEELCSLDSLSASYSSFLFFLKGGQKTCLYISAGTSPSGTAFLSFCFFMIFIVSSKSSSASLMSSFVGGGCRLKFEFFFNFFFACFLPRTSPLSPILCKV